MGVDGLGSEPPLTSELIFERRWSVRLRVGARATFVVGIVALIVAVSAAVILSISFATAGGPARTTIDSARLALLLALALGAVGVAATWRIWRVIRDGRWVPTSPILPALVDDDGQVVIEKYSGACPECGARLRFYNRPVQWHYEPDEGGRHIVVDERTPSAECRRDTRHWWTIDR